MQRTPRSWRPSLGSALVVLAILVWFPAAAQQPAPADTADTEVTPDPPIQAVSLDNLSIGELAGLVSSVKTQAQAPQEWACLGCHESQVEAEAWMASLHRNSDKKVTCTDCHPEAGQAGGDAAKGLPHPAEVSSQHCGDCHDGMDGIMAGAKTTAHGHRTDGANGCGGCHDPHSMTDGLDAAAFVENGCRDCHDQGEDLADKHADFFCQAELHLAKVGCLHCHLEGTDSDAVHNVKFGEAADLACDDCHGAESLLRLAGPVDGEEDAGLLKLQNRKLERETGYLIGANRIWGLDFLIILMVLGSFGFPLVHGGLRIFFHWKAQ